MYVSTLQQQRRPGKENLTFILLNTTCNKYLYTVHKYKQTAEYLIYKTNLGIILQNYLQFTMKIIQDI